NIDGVITNFFDTTNAWDVITEYYSPITREWIPLAYDSSVILSNGSYSITWDINRDISFYKAMDDFTYEYLPFQVVSPDDQDLWGSWGLFDNNLTFKPLIISEVNNNLDISVYKFNNLSGWEVDSSRSNEIVIPSISNQVFKLWDINYDNKYEIIRMTSSHIDVIYLNADNDWVIVENITSLSNYEYFSFDIIREESTTNTLIAFIQKDISGEFSLWQYKFGTNYSLIQLANSESPANFIPTSIKMLNHFSTNNRKAILVGGRIENTYYSQLFEYDYNLNFKTVLAELILGNIIIIEYDMLDGLNTIILGVERVTIGKMDAVVVLHKKTGSDEWIEFELSGFDDVRFEILDLLTISDNNLKKLIIASKTGVFETKITNIEDIKSIISPTIFTFEVFAKQELQPINYPSIFLKNTPIYAIDKVTYKLTGSTQWQEFSAEKYRYSRNEVRLDLQSIWSNLDFLFIAYFFESYSSEERSVVDPSFQSYSGTSDTQSISASGKFYVGSYLPLLWLNPGTTYRDSYAGWYTLPNSMTYQSTPVISGLGTEAIYPKITTGWNNEWGPEYTTMPELENSLIHYADTYDSGILSEELTGKESSNRKLIEDEFDGRFEGNYVDGSWYSNPYESKNFNFSRMYN
ncbi:hypothetical protein LCGC14_2183280, partial [marine sediment metagenome]